MEEIVSIRAVDGVLAIQDDLKDYVDRGSALDNMNLLDFFLNTYDGATSLCSHIMMLPGRLTWDIAMFTAIPGCGEL